MIKLADLLHNPRTLGFQPRHKQERTARQSVELLIPLTEVSSLVSDIRPKFPGYYRDHGNAGGRLTQAHH